MSGRRIHGRLALVAWAAPTALLLLATAAGCGSGPSSRPATGTMPAYFVDDVLLTVALQGGPLQVRSSATGHLVDSPGIQALAVAPLGAAGAFVVARELGDGCTTGLYRMMLSAAGRPGPLTRFGPAIRGQVITMGTDADGGVIGYTAWLCGPKLASGAAPAGSLGVLNVRTGIVRTWGLVDVYGSGSVSAASLSLSADGGLLAFAGSVIGSTGTDVGQGVWLLRTTAPPGTLRERGRLVLASPVAGPALASVILAPGGASFYRCEVTTGQPAPMAEIAEYRAASGQLARVIASLAGHLPASGQAPLGCPMAASPGVRELLVPYWLRQETAPPFAPEVRVARIDVATGAIARLSFRLPGSAGMSVADGLTVAW